MASLLSRHASFWATLWLAALAFEAQPARAALTEAWVQRYSNAVSNSTDQAFKVVRDAAGDIIVTGTTDDGITGQDMLTIKYSGADGTVHWQQRYNGPANSDDRAQAVAVDGSGNAVVTGYSYNGNNWDYYTAKYAAAGGALLWEKRYNGLGNGDDFAPAVAADDSGNVVVTGYSFSGASSYDFYTAKYAAADGALLWEKRYNGPANGSDSASSLALGPNGMVAITGYSSAGSSSSSSLDYATVVYRENLPPVSIALVPTGVRLHFTGDLGRSYTIERAPAVTSPWTTIATSTAPIDGLIEYVDTNPPAGSAFYRTSTP